MHDFSVDFNTINTSHNVDIRKFLMKKYGILQMFGFIKKYLLHN